MKIWQLDIKSCVLSGRMAVQAEWTMSWLNPVLISVEEWVMVPTAEIKGEEGLLS